MAEELGKSILMHNNNGKVLFLFLMGINFGGARGVMVIVLGNGHADTSSNPGRD